jgi:hypothetical protein
MPLGWKTKNRGKLIQHWSFAGIVGRSKLHEIIASCPFGYVFSQQLVVKPRCHWARAIGPDFINPDLQQQAAGGTSMGLAGESPRFFVCHSACAIEGIAQFLVGA